MIGRNPVICLPGAPPEALLLPVDRAKRPRRDADTPFPEIGAAFWDGDSAAKGRDAAFQRCCRAFWSSGAAFRVPFATFLVAFPGKRIRKAVPANAQAESEASKAKSGARAALSQARKAGKSGRDGTASGLPFK